jgi:prephenate dehydrogenase
MPLFERMVIAGVGLIGGSLGLVARERGLVGEVVGFGRGLRNLEVARASGAVDRFSRDPAEAAAGADLLVLAVPVSSMAAVASALLPHATPDAVVIDVGSVKATVVATVEPVVTPPASFVGCHPIAGTERSGAANAMRDLFEGKWCLITPTSRTSAATEARVREFWERVGMVVESISADDHDRLLGLVSHLPHVAAWALIGAIEGVRVGGRDPLRYSGGGLRDTTRIASSHPEMWRDIFLENRDETLRAIDDFATAIAQLRDQIESGDSEALLTELKRLRTARERLLSS